MSLLLGIETSTKMCSVAISEGNKLLAIKEEGGEYSHSEKLTVFIEEVLNISGKKLEQIDAVAVSKGPGSYTGLRIGVSVAKGLCYALNKPLISVSTLQAMARNNSLIETKEKLGEKVLFIPMIDARRMEVYTAIYDENNAVVENISAKIIDETSFSAYLKSNQVLFFGDGAEKCKQVLEKKENTTFIDGVFPSAAYINELGLQQLKAGKVEDVAYFEPYYLKDFITTTPKKIL